MINLQYLRCLADYIYKFDLNERDRSEEIALTSTIVDLKFFESLTATQVRASAFNSQVFVKKRGRVQKVKYFIDCANIPTLANLINLTKDDDKDTLYIVYIRENIPSKRIYDAFPDKKLIVLNLLNFAFQNHFILLIALVNNSSPNIRFELEIMQNFSFAYRTINLHILAKILNIKITSITAIDDGAMHYCRYDKYHKLSPDFNPNFKLSDLIKLIDQELSQHFIKGSQWQDFLQFIDPINTFNRSTIVNNLHWNDDDYHDMALYNIAWIDDYYLAHQNIIRRPKIKMLFPKYFKDIDNENLLTYPAEPLELFKDFNSLTPAQFNTLVSCYSDLNISELYKQLEEHSPYSLIITGASDHFFNGDNIQDEEQVFLPMIAQKMIESYPILASNKINVLFKPRPHSFHNQQNFQALQKIYPNAIYLDQVMPLELIVSAMPGEKYITGFFSTSYITLLKLQDVHIADYLYNSNEETHITYDNLVALIRRGEI